MSTASTLLDRDAQDAQDPASSTGRRRRFSGRPGIQTLIDVLPAIALVVGGWLHRWMNEDAFINLRVVEQIVSGNGPVFNAGERVEAFTSPLWLAILLVIRVTLGQVMAIEWAIVVVSLVMAAGAFWLAARTTRRLHPTGSTVVPVGLLAIAAVPVVWDFSTSGLEMALVWVWLAGSWAILVEAAQRSDRMQGWSRVVALVVLGLGPIVRPDLALMSVCLVMAWIWITGPGSIGAVADIAIAIAIALAYQVFRMGFYASLVPSTALAKDAGGLHVAQGWRYALDLSRPYHLWLPLLVAAGLIASTVARGTRDVRIACGAMVAAALVHTAYLVAIGGDYMHGRLLLPALFALVVPAGAAVPMIGRSATGARSSAPARQRQTGWVTLSAVVAIAVVSAWAVICAGSFRYQNTRSFALAPITSWREISPKPLVQPEELRTFFWGGVQVAAAYERGERGTIGLLGNKVIPSGDPHELVVEFGSIGLAGYNAGTDVKVVDIGGLGEPLASRAEAIPGRPAGHRKQVDEEWYTARFGIPTLDPSRASKFGVPLGAQNTAKVSAARRALRCPPLSDLIAAIDEPLTPGRFLSNLVHSAGYTRLHVPSDPRVAERRFCGH